MERHTIFKLEKLIRRVAPEASAPCCICLEENKLHFKGPFSSMWKYLFARY